MPELDKLDNLKENAISNVNSNAIKQQPEQQRWYKFYLRMNSGQRLAKVLPELYKYFFYNVH